MTFNFDAAARAFVVEHRVAALNGFFWMLSVVGRGGMVWLALAAAISVRRHRMQAFTLTLLAILVASAITDEVLKPLVHRQRPFAVLPGEVIGGLPRDPSFPSGHAANAFAGAATLVRIAPGGAIAWWTLAAAIAFSRVYLGVHYPLDVIGGACVGLVCAWLAARLTRFSKL